ncbi:type II toxin-antitoxin system VapC family toxin [Tumidithrix helvetica]|uniref:type II toxin-antitoxin system VapC family toxin n=1 Tax=Tumidithrix helvetica TaxID=3457545 RepID=UPI003CC5B69D
MAENQFFLDTSYVLSLELLNEKHHAEVLAHWQSLDRQTLEIVTTSYVFDEIVTFFNSRDRHDKAVEVGDRLLNSSIIELVQVDESLFIEAWLFFAKHSDKSYSLTDCISFLVMSKKKISKALTADRHFVQAGFQRLP